MLHAGRAQERQRDAVFLVLRPQAEPLRADRHRMRQRGVGQRRTADERVQLAPEHHPPLGFLLLGGADPLDQLGEPIELLLDVGDLFAGFHA